MLGQWVSPLIGKIIRFGTNKIDYRYCYHRLYFLSGDYSLRVPTVFILFTTYSQCAVCGFQRFLFCLSPYLFSRWHIVPQLCIQIKQSRVHSRKALSECKASRRLGKQIRCFYRFLSKAHPAAPYNIQGSYNCRSPAAEGVMPAAPYNIQGSYNSLSSVFRLRLIEAITFPFHRQKSKYSLSISLSPRSIFFFRNFLLSPSTLYGPTL